MIRRIKSRFKIGGRELIRPFAIFAVFGLLLLAAAPSPALTPPSTEDWERIKLDGRYDEVVANMIRLNEMSRGRPLTEEELIRGIGRDYGKPTTRHPNEARAGSTRFNLDMNGVIDERDVLPLGWREPERDNSITLPFGTDAGGDRPKNLVLLIKFPDQEPTDMTNDGTRSDVNHDTDWATNRWFNLAEPDTPEETSVAYYYKKVSYGKLELDGDVFYHPDVTDTDGWITSIYNREQIDGDGSGDTDNWYDVIDDALQQIDDYVDFRDYDSNGDGFLDGLTVIYAGPSDFSTNMWHLWWYGYINNTMDGIRIYSGIWTSEEAYIRTWCHEYAHELGLPDLYDVGRGDSGPDMPGIGYWGLMGDWGANTGRVPPVPSAFSRMHLRFVEVKDILTTDTAQGINVNRATGDIPADTIFRIWRNGASGKEFFLIEFRDTDHGFDKNLPGGGGLLIWHVDEDRVSAKNRDNDFNPQRVWLECSGHVGNPKYGDNAWYEGNIGDDEVDYFSDITNPSALDNSGEPTFVFIDPTSDNSGTVMTADVRNAEGSGLPGVTWDSPDAGETVSGDVTVDVTSNAFSRVEYYVNGCLKFVELGPAPYDGFTWATLTALDGTAILRATAYNISGTEKVRVIERTVTVANGQGTGKVPAFFEDFDSYASDVDPGLLALWNLHEDAMGLDIRIQSDPAAGDAGNSIAFAQSSFPSPPGNGNNDDPNAGVYEGQDDEWLMTPRINLTDLYSVELSFKVSFKGNIYGQAVMVTQVSADDGATWENLESLTYVYSTPPYYAGSWNSDTWVTRNLSLDGYSNKDVFIRFLYVGGWMYNVAFAIDDVEITGEMFALTSAEPARAVVGGEITLTGTGFLGTQGSGEVRFSDGSGGYVSQPDVISWSMTGIVVTVPTGAKSDQVSGVWVYQHEVESEKLPFTIPLPPPEIVGSDIIE